MKLTIRNFAKIKDTTIELKGLTVVAGNNNTGKSTIGKVLYSIFRGLSNIDSRVKKDIRETIVNAFNNKFPTLTVSAEDIDGIVAKTQTVESVFRKALFLSTENATPDQINAVVSLYLPEIESRINGALEVPAEYTAKRILLKVFECVFHHQFHPLKSDCPNAEIVFTIQGQENVVSFGSERWGRNIASKLYSHVFFVTNPDVLNFVNTKDFTTNKAYGGLLDKYTYELAKRLCDDDDGVSSTDREIDEAKLAPIYEKLNEIIGGTISKDTDSDSALSEKGNAVPTKFGNLSMGLKSFVLLRLMLEKRILSSKDVLILDEPEIHLHPEWQVAYAYAIVALQKVYDLTILVTTHSPFFVNALQRFSITEDVSERTKFYLSEMDAENAGYSKLTPLGNNAGPIFRTFNRAYEAIEPSVLGEGDEING